MITQYASKLTRYYQVSLVLVIVSILATVLYFWKLGFLDGTKGQELHRISYILEEFDNKKPLAEIKNLVWAENSKLAIKKLEIFEDELSKIDNTISISKFSKIEKQIQSSKKDASALISYPKISKILEVFNDKMESFNSYVTKNRWLTLSRMSERVLNRSKGHVDLDSLKTIASKINNDFEQMEKITENSVLGRSEKQEIISRLSNLKVETAMLLKYVEGRDQFDTSMKQLTLTTNSWIKGIKPDVVYQKLQVEQIGRVYITGLLALLLLNLVILFGSFIHNKISIKKLSAKFEKSVKNLITDNILGQSESGLEDASEEFINFTAQTGHYINKRMNFGSVFQEALPLASVLLDSNLKVVWTNKHFLEQWDIPDGEISKENLSWDYLMKMTNIGDDDPVMEALKNGIAGIYQVQIKCQKEGEIRPFEMYVSPVTFNHRTRIMLFFYSLVSLQDTIKDQAKSIVTPINKSLDLLINQRYDELTKNNFGKEFEIGGIEFVQDKFILLRDQIKENKSELRDEVEYLQKRCDIFEAVCNHAFDFNEQNLISTKLQVENLKEVKQWVIELSTAGKNFESLNNQSEGMLENAMANLNEVMNGHGNLGNIALQIIDAFPKFESIKEDFRTYKNEVIEARNRLSHSITQFTHIKRKIVDAVLLDRFTKTYERVSVEYSQLEEATNALDKKLTNLEVLFSKSKLMIAGLDEKLQSSLAIKAGPNIESLFNHYDALKSQIQNSQGSQDQAEEQVVFHLQQLFLNTKDSFKSGVEVRNSYQSLVAQEADFQANDAPRTEFEDNHSQDLQS